MIITIRISDGQDPVRNLQHFTDVIRPALEAMGLEVLSHKERKPREKVPKKQSHV
jgi:hypothetical protein